MASQYLSFAGSLPKWDCDVRCLGQHVICASSICITLPQLHSSVHFYWVQSAVHGSGAGYMHGCARHTRSLASHSTVAE